MTRLNYVLVSGRLSKTSILEGWRPTKPKPYATLAADIGVSAVIKTKRQLYRAATRQERVGWMDVDPAPYTEKPSLNTDGPGVDASTRTASASPVSEALAAAQQKPIVQTDVDPVPRPHHYETSASTIDHHGFVSCRKRKAHEEFPESSVIPPTKKVRMDLPTPSTVSISSRKAEKARAREEPVDVPSMSLRKAEKARACEDSVDVVNAVLYACSELVKESRLPAPIRRPIVTTNMGSSSKVKLEDIRLPTSAIHKLSAPIRLPDVRVNNGCMSLNKPIKDINPPVLPPQEPAIVTDRTIGQPDNSNEETDVIMFEDDYVDLPPTPDVVMFKDDYVDVRQTIGGYNPEYGLDMQVDLEGVAGRHKDGVPLNCGPVDVFTMPGYVPEFTEVMEIDSEGASIRPGNRPGNVEAHTNPIINGVSDAARPAAENVFGPNLGVAGTLLNGPQVVFPINADAINLPYDPKGPLFPPRTQVEPFVAVPQLVRENFFMEIHINVPVPAYDIEPRVIGALNAPVDEQAIGDTDDHEELFNELFGDDGEEDGEEDEDEEEEEDVLQVFV